MRELPHIHQTAPVAERVLLPGDPGRARRLAGELLHEPELLNEHRGLLGYSGAAIADGLPLTIQCTGMGGPSAAIVASELIELGARRLLRIGTCGALLSTLQLGTLVIATAAIGDDGTSRALGADVEIEPSTEMLDGLRQAAAAAAATADDAGAPTSEHEPVPEPEPAFGPVLSTDLFYDAEPLIAGWRRRGAIAVEMEAATIFALAARRQVQAACVLLAVNSLVDPGVPALGADPERLHAREVALGRLAVAALAA
jgi:DeoD family purine-nucleoside phosphorylase